MQVQGQSIAMRAEALAGAGRVLEAMQLLTAPQAASDADALFTLAMWRFTGRPIGRDLAAAREFFRRSGAAGRMDAAYIFMAFLANGTGGPAQWEAAVKLLRGFAARDPKAARQLALIDAMKLDPAGDPLALPPPEPLSEIPHVVRFPGLFTVDECRFLIEAAEPLLLPAVVVDPQTGREIRNPVRTSDGAGFPLSEESPAIHALNRRIAAASGTVVSQGEPLQVLRYRPGQEYKPHLDGLPRGDNQRVLTMLVYLNDDYEGGETVFLENGLKVKGRTGDGLLFRNALPDGRADESTQHAGLPVTAGEKLIASRWIRARPFTFPPPRPLLDL